MILPWQLAQLFARTLQMLIGVQAPVVEEAAVKGREEDAPIVDEGGGHGGDGEGGEVRGGLQQLFGEGHSHCHVAMRR